MRRSMDIGRIRELLEKLRTGALGVDEGLAELRDLPYRDLGYATGDHHRAPRSGLPEVILGEPKTAAQIVGIARELLRTGQNVLITRLDAAKAAEVTRELGEMKYAALGRVGSIETTPIVRRPGGKVAVVTAGTGDLPVAEEATETLRMMGIETLLINDVGVAGIHRLLDKRSLLESAAGIIVVAGMEGALPS